MVHDHSNRFKQLGLNITYYRKLKDWTQEQLEERAEISRTHLSNIEASNAPKSISLETLFKIAEVLGVEPSRFLEIR